jgi:hypothetical protein
MDGELAEMPGRLAAKMSREEQAMRRQGQDKSGNAIGIK